MGFYDYAFGYQDQTDNYTHIRYPGAPHRLAKVGCKFLDGSRAPISPQTTEEGTTCEGKCNGYELNPIQFLPTGILKYECVKGSWEERDGTPKSVTCAAGAIFVEYKMRIHPIES